MAINVGFVDILSYIWLKKWYLTKIMMGNLVVIFILI
jgi:hypothetical protein